MTDTPTELPADITAEELLDAAKLLRAKGNEEAAAFILELIEGAGSNTPPPGPAQDIAATVDAAVTKAFSDHYRPAPLQPAPQPQLDVALSAIADSIAALAARPAPEINVHPPAINVAPPVVNVAPPNVTVSPPVVNVNAPTATTKNTTITRDASGEIVGILTTEGE